MKKRYKFRPLVALLLLLSLSLSSCGGGNEKDGIKIEHNELGIVLPRSFSRLDASDSFDIAYSNGEIFVGILRISLDYAAEANMPTTLTPMKLCEYYRRESETENSSSIAVHGDVPYYSYVAGKDEGAYFYLPSFYVTPYAYFVITFITPVERGEALTEEILSYISGVYLIL